MIKRLRIKNFQSHLDTTLDLCTGVNVITGKSQAGKTAIFRALRWVVFNRPTGFRFLPSFPGAGGSTKISLKCDDKLIIHEKSKKDSRYSILNGKTKETFSKVGTNVPEEVSNVLKLTDLNFQDQLDSPFLITSSPGEIAKVINKVTNLDRVDGWVAHATRRINSLSSEESILSDDVQSIKEQLKEFDDLDDIETQIKKLEGIDRRISKYVGSIASISKLSEQIVDAEDSISYCEEGLEAEALLDKIDENNKEINRLIDIEDKIMRMLELSDVADEFDAEGFVSWFEHIDMNEVVISEANKKIKRLETLYAQYLVVDASEGKLAQETKKFKRMLKQTNECPTCSTTLDAIQIERIISEIS